jgi:hypothetical protein
MAPWQLPAELVVLLQPLTALLHQRCAWRLLPLLTGMLFARGRCTVASWLRAGGLGQEYRQYYYFLGSLGRNTSFGAAQLLRRVVALLPLPQRLLLALDDSPTPRYGPHVQGAGIHHNPTPGPAAPKFLYGHVWVTLALLLRHPLWGTIGLPLRAWLYVRQKDLAKLPARYGVTFQTKLQMAAEAIAWLAQWLQFLGKPLWLVADGAYAKRVVFLAAKTAGVILVSRLRRDAALWSVPVPARPGATRRRGQPRKYGTRAISLAKRAGHRAGWQTGRFTVYGHAVDKTFKTFVATYKPAGGLLRVVLLKEDNGWLALCCTDPEAPVAQIVEAYADRAAIEQDFHDVKEVHGAGQQQVRNYWANVAVFHLNLWLHTLIEVWAWRQPQAQLCDRSASPWDDAARRPSHADRRNALRRQSIQEQYRHAGLGQTLTPTIHALVTGLVQLVA